MQQHVYQVLIEDFVELHDCICNLLKLAKYQQCGNDVID